ncbi:nuclease [Bacillus sp. KH172YL63]|nr:nuclease [Bacillus sp. KH172YL63]
MAGYKGELAMDYTLSFLDPKRYFILHDLRIPYKDSFFQIDTLLITTRFILIIEVKYLAGVAYFDPVFNQLIQTKDGSESALPDPTLQIKRQERHLSDWIRQQGFPTIPIHSYVVMSNDRTIIKTSPDNHSLNGLVIHRHSLLDKLSFLEEAAPEHQAMNVKKLIRTLKKHHREATPSILQKFSINEDELQKGVICETCSHLPMIRKHGTWVCSKCENLDHSAHIQAMKDYELLISPTITNTGLRSYLGIQSPYVAKRLLQSLKFPKAGTKKGTIYTLTFTEMV